MQETNRLILVTVGPDKVGLVEHISRFIVQHGCNIEDSKMAVFVGEFAFIALLSGGKQDLAALGKQSHELADQTGLNVWVKQPTAKQPARQTLPYRLTASCMDHPGVVHRISTALSRLKINIESMETETYAAPISGTPIFRMQAEISVPADLNINQLRSLLQEMEKQENVDIELTLT